MYVVRELILKYVDFFYLIIKLSNLIEKLNLNRNFFKENVFVKIN